MTEEWLSTIERGLRERLAQSGLEGLLREACEYAVFSGGKRFRPLLTLAAAEACGGQAEKAVAAACAVEFLHTFTLIQDDLPDLDNAYYRRGREATHIRFGVATALMASDALFGLAFYTLATAEASAEIRAQSVAISARRIALPGVIGGQMDDLRAPWHSRSPVVPREPLSRLWEINRRKTGSLMALSLELGALLARASNETIARLGRIGEKMGILFQVADDLEDPGDRKKLGDVLGGLEELQARADALYEETLAEARPFGRIAQFVEWAYRRDRKFPEASPPDRGPTADIPSRDSPRMVSQDGEETEGEGKRG